MAFTGKLLVIQRSDLNHWAKSKSIDDIGLSDIGNYADSTRHDYLHADIVMFIDYGGVTRILKNRWGNKGMVVNNNIPLTSKKKQH